jgi:hypothetical protein
MTPGAILFMSLSWTFVLGLVVWAVITLLRKGKGAG